LGREKEESYVLGFRASIYGTSYKEFFENYIPRILDNVYFDIMRNIVRLLVKV